MVAAPLPFAQIGINLQLVAKQNAIIFVIHGLGTVFAAIVVTNILVREK